jgi:hypothetical protein
MGRRIGIKVVLSSARRCHSFDPAVFFFLSARAACREPKQKPFFSWLGGFRYTYATGCIGFSVVEWNGSEGKVGFHLCMFDGGARRGSNGEQRKSTRYVFSLVTSSKN